MTTLIVLIGAVFYLVLYFTWGKRLEKNVVKADGKKETPAVRLRDNVDYVPAHRFVLFGHHFASIAGAGPITGPAIAMAWGWLPGLLWVWFGNLFIGSIHDYLSLMASVRYDGNSVQWVAGKLMGERTKFIFELFTYFTLLLILAAFMGTFGGLAITSPEVVTASVLFIIIAVIEGFLLYRTKLPFWLTTVIGVAMLVIVIVISFTAPFITATNAKTVYIILFFYMILASSLPVWILLQPRDYLNSFLLYGGLILGGVGALIGFKGFSWPAFTTWTAHAVTPAVPSAFWPTVPLVIACGALSGFHALVASGTSSKQLDNELSGLFVGYGGMFTEGFLATLVIVSISAFGMDIFRDAASGISQIGLNVDALAGGGAVLGDNYLKVINAKETGIGAAMGIFRQSFGRLLNNSFGIPVKFGATFAGLWASAFVLTTLDTATRLARYAWQELFQLVKSKPVRGFLTDKWIASIIASGLGLYLVWTGSYNALWSGFAGANQLLASIALLTASVWVKNVQKAGRMWTMAVVIPAVFLWITAFIALIWYVIVVIPTLNLAFRIPMYIFLIVMIILDVYLVGSFFTNFRKTPEEFAKERG